MYDHILCWSRCTLVCAFVVNAKANAGFFSHDTATSLPRPSRRSRTLRFNSNSHCDCSVVTGWGVETQTKVLVQRLLINMRCTINSVTRSMNCPVLSVQSTYGSIGQLVQHPFSHLKAARCLLNIQYKSFQLFKNKKAARCCTSWRILLKLIHIWSLCCMCCAKNQLKTGGDVRLAIRKSLAE